LRSVVIYWSGGYAVACLYINRCRSMQMGELSLGAGLRSDICLLVLEERSGLWIVEQYLEKRCIIYDRADEP